MRLLMVSEIYTLPEVSTVTPLGAFSEALVEGPLSPPKPAVPVPAMVTIVVVVAFVI